jgi:hypothetical protein
MVRNPYMGPHNDGLGASRQGPPGSNTSAKALATAPSPPLIGRPPFCLRGIRTQGRPRWGRRRRRCASRILDFEFLSGTLWPCDQRGNLHRQLPSLDRPVQRHSTTFMCHRAATPPGKTRRALWKRRSRHRHTLLRRANHESEPRPAVCTIAAASLNESLTPHPHSLTLSG